MNGQIAATANPGVRGVQKWYKRNIICDHCTRVIYIQLMWDSNGHLELEEYRSMIKRDWFSYVPKYMLPNIKAALASGYEIKPVVVVSDNSAIDEEYHIVQVVDINNERNVFKYECLQPIEG